ncbi:MAG: hypothetical protein ACRESE_03745 [Gammaproteobacteria bacterium]
MIHNVTVTIIMHSIPMNVWPSRPLPVKPADWQAISRTQTRAVLRYAAICKLAGVPARVTGADLERQVHILNGTQHFYPVGQPDEIGVALPQYRGSRADALRVLEILAYGFVDYAAREAVRGRGLFLPAPRRGRKATGKALTGAERMRRLRLKAAPSPTTRSGG